MNLNELRDEAYAIAVEHGWHEEYHSYNHWCMLIICEIAEMVEADRKNKHAKSDYYKKVVTNSIICKGLDPDIPSERGYQAHFEEAIKDSVEDEFADVVIRLLDMCGLYSVDLSKMPDPFVVHDNDIENGIIRWITNKSTTAFAYDCTELVSRIYDDGIRWGDIEVLLHRIYLYSTIKGFDLEWHVKEKMRYNKTRPYKHGKEY